MSAPDPNEHGLLGERLKRAADAAAPSPIDVDEVLRRSRAARRSRRTALVSGVGAVAGLLAVTGLVLGLPGLRGPTATDGQVALESAESSGVPPEAAEGTEGSRLVAPYEVNRCGAPAAPATDAATTPLAVAVDAPSGPVRPGTSNPVAITVTNAGAEDVTGAIDLDAPLTVASSGVTVWQDGPVPDLPPLAITLAPGESVELQGSFETRSCDPPDADGTSPTVAPALEPGEYGLSAVVSYTAPDGVHSYLISPLAPVTVG